MWKNQQFWESTFNSDVEKDIKSLYYTAKSPVDGVGRPLSNHGPLHHVGNVGSKSPGVSYSRASRRGSHHS